MSVDEQLRIRLDQILPKITQKEFLSGEGRGNEIGFYIFEYPPEQELMVRKHVSFMLERIKKHYGLRVMNVNLFDLIIDYLKERKLIDKSIEIEQKKGAIELQKALKAPLKAENAIKLFTEQARPSEMDLVFMTGVGSAWPLLRTHTLLNNLQSVMGDTPLITFYPGRYDGQHVKLFGKLKSNPYYRAFQLVP